MEIGYHVLMLRGTNLAQLDSIPEMRHKRFVRKHACRSKGGKYGNLPRVRQTSLAMPEPATRGEELEGGFGGVRTGNRGARKVPGGLALAPPRGARLQIRLLESRRTAAYEDVRAQPGQKFLPRLQMSRLDGKSEVPRA